MDSSTTRIELLGTQSSRIGTADLPFVLVLNKGPGDIVIEWRGEKLLPSGECAIFVPDNNQISARCAQDVASAFEVLGSGESSFWLADSQRTVKWGCAPGTVTIRNDGPLNSPNVDGPGSLHVTRQGHPAIEIKPTQQLSFKDESGDVQICPKTRGWGTRVTLVLET